MTLITAPPNPLSVGSTSGIMDVMFGVRNTWDQRLEFKATPNPEGKKRVLRGILESYYADKQQDVIFDKCRGWIAPGMLEMFEELFGVKAKVLVPVRDLREILASFEKLFRKSPLLVTPLDEQGYFASQTVEGRVSLWMQGNGPVGLAYNRVNDVIRRKLTDRLLFPDAVLGLLWRKDGRPWMFDLKWKRRR